MSTEVRAFTAEYDSLANVLLTQVTIYNSLKPNKLTTVDAIWDTGATSSCISEKVANDLALNTIGYVQMSTAGGIVRKKRYVVDVALPNKVGVRKVLVTEAVLNGCDVLIGMDIISLGDFSISNYKGKTKFTFRIPSIRETDYCKPDQKVPAVSNKIGRNTPCPCGSGKKYKNRLT
jgi:predicted aspartyl protease